MKTLDAGHLYELSVYDGPGRQELRFMKREGEGYPGNVGRYAGTNCQEVLRALVDRVTYLDGQIPCSENAAILRYLRLSIYLFERRAAIRHGRTPPPPEHIENNQPCETCGHSTCEHMEPEQC